MEGDQSVMSKTIDQKVVEMRFENAQFEKGIAQSMSSLDKLKQSLDFSGLTDVGTDINKNLTGIGSSVDNISEKFSAFGIMAMTSLVKLSERIIEVGLSIKENLMENITAGYEKYNTLMESVQTIMYATRQDWADTGRQMSYVSDQIAKLNWYTDETSYNLVDMTSNIGKFVAAGIDLDDATTAMMGISSWAAMSGQKADAASRAMYNLSQAMALGAVTTIDWKSIEMANMATKEFKETAIKTALELGVLNGEWGDYVYGFDQYGHEMEVNVNNFRSTLSGKWFNNDVLTAVLKKYGDFSDELYSYVNKTGLTATEFLGYINEYKKGMEQGQDMSEWIIDVVGKEGISNITAFKEGLASLSTEYMELGRQAFMAGQECKTFEDVTLALKDAISSAWMGIFTAIFGNYKQSKELWTSIAEEMYELLVDGLNTKRRLLESWNLVGGREHLVNALWNIWYNVKDVLTAFSEAFNEVFPEKNAVYWSNLMGDFERFTEKLRFVDFPWAPELTIIADAAKNVAEAFKNILDNIKAVAKQAKKAWDRIFPDDKTLGNKQLAILNGILDITEGFKDFTENLKFTDEQLDKIERSFAGLFAILDILKMLFIAIITPLTNFRTGTVNLTDPILDVTSSIGDWLVALRDWIAENDIFTKAVAKVIEWISQIPTYLEMATQALFGLTLDEVWDKIVEGATYALGAVVYFFTNLPELAEQACQLLFHTDLSTFWENLKEWVLETWDSIVEFFEKLPEKVSETTDFLFDTDFHTWWENIKTWVSDAWDKIQEFFENLPSYIDYAKHKLNELWDIIKKIFKEDIPEKIDEISEKIFGKPWAEVIQDIKDAINDLKDAWNDFWGIGEKFDPPELEELDPNKLWFVDAAWYRNLGREMTAPKSGIERLKDKWDDFFEAVGVDLVQFFSEHKFAAGGIASIALLAAIVVGLKTLFTSFTTLLTTVENFDFHLFETSSSSIVFALNDFIEAMTGIGKKIPKLIPMIQFKLIADAILEIAAAVFLIGYMDYGKLAASLGVIITILTTIYLYMSKLSRIDSAQMWALGVNTLEICAGLLLVALGLTALASMPVEGILAALLAVEAIFTCIAGFFVVMTGLGVDGEFLLEISGAMLLASVGITAMCLGLALLSELDPLQIIAAGDAIAVMLLALSGALVIIDKVGVSTATLYGFALAVLAVGAGAALAGVGIWMVSEAIANLIGQGTEGIDNIIYGIVSFFDVLPQLAEKTAEAFVAFIQVFVDSKDTLLAGLDLLLDVIVTSLTGALPKFLEFGTQMFIGILQAGIDAMPKIVEFLQVLFDTIVDLTIGWTPRIIDTVIFIVTELLRSMVVLTPMITSAALAILIDTLAQLAENIGTIVMLLTQILIETILGTIDGITAELPHIMESIWNFVITLINTFADGLDEHAEELRNAVTHLMESLWEAICTFFGIHSPSTKFFDMAGDMIQGMIDGLKAMIEKAKEAITELADKVLTKICDFFGIKKPESQNEFLNLGKTIIQKFIDGIGKMIESAKTKIRELADAVLTKICDFFGIKKPETQNEFLNLGKTIIQKFNQGIYNMISKAKEMILNLATNVINKVKEFFGIETDTANGSFFDIAVQLINGFIQGIKDKINSAVSTIGDFCDDVIEKCKNTFGVASPSKVFMQIGRFLDEGLVVGIGEYAYRVIDASEDMANTAIDAVSSAISGIADIVDENLEDPTIKPIMDLSDVVNGTNAINDMLGSDRAFSLAADSSYDINRSIVANNAPSALDDLIATLSGTPNGDTITQNNVFNITGNDPKAIAEEVSNILQHDVERRDKVWE